MGFVLKQADYVEYQGLKVSSSRIKKEIAAGNFAEVREMLGRPFAISLKGHKFVKKAEGSDLSAFETLLSDDQVFPEKGSYKVVVSFADGNILHSVLNIEENRISLLLPTQKYADNAVAVVF